MLATAIPVAAAIAKISGRPSRSGAVPAAWGRGVVMEAPGESDVARNGPQLGCPVRQFNHGLVDIAPAPAFRRVIAFDDRVASRVEMGGGVAVRALVAAAD